MGSYVITIQAVGPHHNQVREDNANDMASAFVDVLQQAGHKIESATFTYGGRDELLPPARLAFFRGQQPPLVVTEIGRGGHEPAQERPLDAAGRALELLREMSPSGSKSSVTKDFAFVQSMCWPLYRPENAQLLTQYVDGMRALAEEASVVLGPDGVGALQAQTAQEGLAAVESLLSGQHPALAARYILAVNEWTRMMMGVFGEGGLNIL